MRTLLVILLIIFSFCTYSQTTGLEDSKINFTQRDSLVNQKEFAILDSYDINDISKKSLWAYYSYKACLHFYLGKDSVLYNLNQAFSLNERAVCRGIVGLEGLIKHVISIGREDPDFSIFLWDMPDDMELYIRDRCEKYEDKEQNEDTRKKSPIEQYIMSNDQKYRGGKGVNWTLQNPLDLRNRDYLDSLYTTYNSFSDFSRYELDAFSFVLHHSDDCEWNKKWILIWLKEISQHDMKGGALFGQAMIRMLEPEIGVCWNKDSESTRVFIDRLKKKFSHNLAIQYGYVNY